MIDASSVKDVCEKFFVLENEHGLLDYEVDGVKLWQYMRIQIYYKVAQQLGIISDPHPLSGNRLQTIREFAERFKNALLKYPFKNLSQVDYVILPHTRSKEVNGELVDIYSQDIISCLESKGKTYVSLEYPFQGFHQRVPNDKVRYMDYLPVRLWWRKYVLRIKPSSQANDQVKNLVKLVDEAFGIDSELLPRLLLGLQKFQSNYTVYSALLKRMRPKAIFLVISYAHSDLIKAAKDLSIEVVEMQHGTLSRYHLGYNFPERRESLEYFPDKIIVWGQFWKDMIGWPLPDQNIQIYCFNYFLDLHQRYEMVKRNENQIIVLSQGVISKSLSGKLLDCLKSLENYEIYYKLHPSEYRTWHKNESYVKLSKVQNVKIVGDDVDLYRLLVESTYQFGVFSTAIYEGIGMGCKTILFDLPGVEYMECLVDRKLAVIHLDEQPFQATLMEAANIQTINVAEEIFGCSFSHNTSIRDFPCKYEG